MSSIATHRELTDLTGSDNPDIQYQRLRSIGCNPFFIDGKVRIYREALIKVQTGEGRLWHVPPKNNAADLESDDLTTLYRHWGNGELLYVGISLSVVERTRKHSGNAHWFNQIDTITVERFSTREEALKAERAAIVTEKPLYNIAGAE